MQGGEGSNKEAQKETNKEDISMTSFTKKEYWRPLLPNH